MDRPDPSLESYELELGISCDACRIGLPVNGLTERVRCHHCAAETSLDGDLWKKLLEDDRLAQARKVSGETQRVRLPFVHAADLRFTHRAPRCLACTAQLDPNALLGVASTASARCFCPGCGATIPLREPDARIRSLAPRVRALVHETSLDGEAAAIEAQTAPVVLACMKCGAGLDADGSTRSVPCKFCSAANYLPDGLWQQLRPVPRTHPWFVILGRARSR